MQLNSNVHTLNELLTSHSSSCALLNFVMKKYFATSFPMKRKEKQLCNKEVFGLDFFLFWGTAHYTEKEKKEKESGRGRGRGEGEGKKDPYNRFIHFLQLGINDPH